MTQTPNKQDLVRFYRQHLNEQMINIKQASKIDIIKRINSEGLTFQPVPKRVVASKQSAAATPEDVALPDDGDEEEEVPATEAPKQKKKPTKK
jgi:hypothetical protein